ncbi:MAG: histidine--tRNA ligase [Peptococcaceae bacterium]|jgi:histidyl-tRNA synthetase|nr:histidine--tRNA ligase [Peptococcaceae bacterium]
MTLTKTPVKGMKDILPEEMAIRDYAIGLIKDTYKSFGFTPIDTPCMEHIGNLTSKQGGENESLIYKVMKRGEKLSLEGASTPDDLVDNGLRYDLTVSLCRFYANNLNSLPNPFKALQIGSVWRADQPQKGRFRQFTQCDIDVLGEGSMLAEIELITATSTLLGKLGFSGFTVHLNHRQLLKAMAAYCGFPAELSEKVFIILDKMDKIGISGVSAELLELELPQVNVDRYMEFFKPRAEQDLLGYCIEKLTSQDGREGTDPAFAETIGVPISEIQTILNCIEAIKECIPAEFEIVFDPALVRGMGYYTGPIFEITLKEFGSSVAGGGRYDQLVGNFTSLQVPACGFSIGFERIISVLMDQGFTLPSTGQKIAFLAEKGIEEETIREMLLEAGKLRGEGASVLVTARNKNSKFQKEQLEKEGYTEFRNFYKKQS